MSEVHDSPDEEVLEAPARGSAEELLDAHAGDPLDPMRHSAAHVMAEAVLGLFPDARLGIGPAIRDGFYYDFELPRPLTPDDLEAIDAGMRASIKADHPFVRHELPPAEGRAFFEERGQPFKVEILDDLGRAADAAGQPHPVVSTYTHGSFVDLCRGPHVASTGRDRALRAAERGRRLLARRREAADAPADLRHRLGHPGGAGPLPVAPRGGAKRDHRRLGVALDLFSFHDVAPGSAFWHPKGQRLWRTLEDAMRGLQARYGYDEVSTPILVHQKLWQQSGHLPTLRRHDVPLRYRGPGLLAQAHELPREHVHLPQPRPVLP